MATKVDLRLKSQRFSNIWDKTKYVYVWKVSNNLYHIGINGTSLHEKVSKIDLSWAVTRLRNMKV